MLSRPKMDVDECVPAYKDLMKAVLEERLRRVPISWTRKLKSAFEVTPTRSLNQADSRQ
jgi:hypothetical protein